MEKYYILKVLDQSGNYYDNAFIENDFDAAQVYRLYTEVLGYDVQIWHEEKDITSIIAKMKSIVVSQ